ncbi:hypothetical protein DDE82_007444 [Stemphylium lycopersici]|uniref:Uncharacterized protein n=1 Tax=Stemphylium lycopersici TaxID=183478 RepID=A0A364MVU5_STELY|nr:hypothetical protein TW65_01261 [Stemphylium lycopersici]RAR00285.1 hypothetical protein DDE82_007444 [Stemphylium lycopersici]RAR05176.1 hypothetical protein DDE83_007538 [Stemphylium lycopersici]
MPIPNVASPYDHEGEEEDDKEDENDTPDVTINAATQIRGNGNIISIAQMDSVRIANLITSMLNGDNKEPADAARPITPPSPPTMATAQPEQTSRTQVRGVKKFPNINITVNCGATIIGDRNIVGPGLGDIARQMQVAQRNQAAALHAQQLQQQQAAAAQGQKMPSPPLQRNNTLYHAQAGIITPHYTAPAPLSSLHGVATPPMSRSSSLHSDGESKKRKFGDVGEGNAAKRHC